MPAPSFIAHPHLVLLSSIFLTTVSGTILFFPSFAHLLSPPLRLSSFQTSIIISAANCGSLVGVFCGFIHSRLGTRTTALLGSSLITSGYLWVTVLLFLSEGGSPEPHSHSYGLHFTCTLFAALLINTGSNLNYVAGLMAVSASFDTQLRDKLYGLLSSAFALSSGLCGLFQKSFFNEVCTVSIFLCSVSAASIASAILLNGQDFCYQNGMFLRSGEYGHSNWKISWASLVVISISLVLLQHGYATSKGKLTEGSATAYLVLLLLFFLGVLVIKDRPLVRNTGFERIQDVSLGEDLGVAGSGTIIVDRKKYDSCDGKAGVRTRSSFQQQNFSNVVQVALTKRCLILFLVQAIVYGSSLSLLSNAYDLVLSRFFVPSSMHNSKSYPLSSLHSIYYRSNGNLVMFSTFNVFGRILLGMLLSTEGTTGTRIPKEFYLTTSLSILSCGFLAIIFVPLKFLFIPFLIVGLSFGSVATLAPVLISAWFGDEMLPTLYGLLGLSLTIGGVVLPTTLFKIQKSLEYLYPKVIIWVKGSKRAYCIGQRCYLLAFLIDLVFCVCSVLLSLQISRRAGSQGVEFGVGAQAQQGEKSQDFRNASSV